LIAKYGKAGKNQNKAINKKTLETSRLIRLLSVGKQKKDIKNKKN